MNWHQHTLQVIAPKMIPKLDLRRAVGGSSTSLRTSTSQSLSSSATGRVCGICTTAQAAYTCPRCFIVYCSLACYKGHGEGCTEEFSRDKIRSVLSYEDKAKPSSTEHFHFKGREEGASLIVRGEEGEKERGGRVSSVFMSDTPDTPDAPDFLDASGLAARLEAADFDTSRLSRGDQAQLRRMAMAGTLDGGLELARPWWVGGGGVLGGGAPGHLLGVEVDEAGDKHQHQHGHEQQEVLEVQQEVLEVVRGIHGNEIVFTAQMGMFLQWTAGIDAPLPRVPATPSAPLSYHMLDVLAAYVMAMRTYNMNW